MHWCVGHVTALAGTLKASPPTPQPPPTPTAPPPPHPHPTTPKILHHQPPRRPLHTKEHHPWRRGIKPGLSRLHSQQLIKRASLGSRSVTAVVCWSLGALVLLQLELHDLRRLTVASNENPLAPTPSQQARSLSRSAPAKHYRNEPVKATIE